MKKTNYMGNKKRFKDDKSNCKRICYRVYRGSVS